MCQGELAGNFTNQFYLVRVYHPHADHHCARKRTRWDGLNVRPVHRYRGVVVNVPDFDARLLKRMLEGKRTSQRKSDGSLRPVAGYVLSAFVELAVAVYVVQWNIGPDVDVLPQRKHHRIAGVRHANQRAGLRVPLAVAHEVQGVFHRQNRQIGLKKPAAKTSCM